MRHPCTSLAASAATAALAFGALSTVPAGAVPAVSCGSITVNHVRYSVRAHVLSCGSARSWSVNFLAHNKVPAGYDCQRYSPKVTRVRFLCDDPATVTRIDGPRSFSASR